MAEYKQDIGHLKKTEMEEKLTKTELINLLNSYLSLLPSRWNSLQIYINIYIVTVTSIFTATIAGFATTSSTPNYILLSIGPIISFLISDLARKTIKRKNRHIKELIVVIAKIEYKLGLYENWGQSEDINQPWKKDESILYPEWVKIRITSGDNSQDFVDKFQTSSAKLAYHIFLLFQILSACILVFIILFLCQ